MIPAGRPDDQAERFGSWPDTAGSCCLPLWGGNLEGTAVIFAIIALSLVVFAALAMRESPLWQWGVALVVIGLLSGVTIPDGGISYELGGGSWFLLRAGAVFLILSIEAIRKPLLVTPI